MNTQTLLVFSVLLCAIVVTNAHPGGKKFDKKKWEEKMKKCGDEEINVKEAFKGVEKCKPEETSTESSRRRRSPDGDADKKKEMWKKAMEKHLCSAVCTWKEQGILDDSGNFNEAGAKEHMDKVYPEKYRADAIKNLKECATNSSSTFSMENNCIGYKDFKTCTFRSHMKTCGIEWKKGKDNKQGEGEGATEE